MPLIEPRQIGLAFDMFGCPNRCRHCYIGRQPNEKLSEEDVRWAVDQFRGFTQSGEDSPFFESINVVTWNRDPDYSDDYKRLYELEVELSDTKTYRAEWELLSIWRLARDERYAPWAHGIGVRTCQITFFGIGETHDWFCRRPGAFQDCLTATERLLDAGIKPHWQLFLTRKMIPELGELLGLVDKLRLRERVAALGGEFTIFLHTPGPEGEARFIEHLRPTIEEAKSIPAELVAASEKHIGVERLWKTVGERVIEILNGEEHFPHTVSYPKELFFIIQSNWDVFTNMGTGEPWWILGNMRRDSLQDIVDNFERTKSIGLRVIYNVSLKDLAKQYGDPSSRLINGGVENLWLADYCEQQMAERR